MNGERLTGRLAELAQRHHAPGAGLAVLSEGAVVEAAYGSLNQGTGVDVTTDSLFQIGSITKSYTATMVMQLVDRGEVRLDEPVMSYLPEFTVSDPEVAKRVTVRHLLTHTSGIDGDHFADTGRGDDCLEHYVEGLAELRQSHPLGATMSYCNAGYSLLGRLIERLTNSVWDAALQDLLIGPLGLTHTVTLPEDALRYRTAMGHIGKPGEDPQPAPQWGLMRSAGPAGLICARPSDVIAFARLHLDGGVDSSGVRLLSEESVLAMQQPQVPVPDRWTLGDHWGLGWILFSWQGRRVYGHDGNTLGQSAYLRIVPDAKVAIALLTNGGNALDLYQDLFRELLPQLAGLDLPPRPQPPAAPVEIDPMPFLGTYERSGARLEVELIGGALQLTVTRTGPLAKLMPDPVEQLALTAVSPSDNLFVTRPQGSQTWLPVVFFALGDGSRYVHFGARATPKVR